MKPSRTSELLPGERLKRVRERLRPYLKPEDDLVAELIATRREEAAREEKDDDEEGVGHPPS